MISFLVNGSSVKVDAEPDTPLLWVIREHLKLTGTKFGCGMGQCGACMVHIEGETGYACLTPVTAVAGKNVTTIEGLSPDDQHPLQKAWVELEVPQCGYCQSGQIMRAAVLLEKNKNPSREEVVNHMSTNLCRCGTYPTIIKAIQLAAEEA
jgi:isoquinoline 1-oxidoreductase alpha subunit